MADNPGILVDGQFNFVRPGTIIPTFVAPVIGYHAPGDSGRAGNEANAVKLNAPGAPSLSQSAQSFATNKGILIEGFYDFFWKNRLHISPTRYDLGNIISPQQREFEVYNAGETFDDQRLLNVITQNDGDGFQFISGPTTLPDFIGAHESFVYVWEVSEDGLPTLDMSLDFEFADGVILSHFITGSRLVMFGFVPQDNMSEVLEWYTSILPAGSGKEQRISGRDVPTRAFSRSYHLDDALGGELESLIWGWQDRQIGLPIWEDEALLTTAITAGDVAINVDSTTSLEFRDGGLCLAIIDRDNFEAFSIDTVVGTTINILSPALNAWPVGTRILPMVTAYMRDDIQQDLWVGDGLRRFQITFDVLNNFEQPSEAGFAIYRTFPVWEDGIQLSSERYQRVFKNNIVRAKPGRSTANFVNRTRRTQPVVMINGMTLYAEDKAALVRLRGWLDARRGQQKAFWLPSSKRDLSIVNDNVGTVDEIDVEPLNYERFVESAPNGRRDIRIEYIDGSIDYRRITGSQVFAGYERLTLDSVTSQVYSAANVERTSFMTLVRHAVDKLTIEHDRLDDVRINVPLIEVNDS